MSESGANAFMVATYRPIFDGILRNEEVLLNAGSAIHIEASKLFGWGYGDGFIGITNCRLIHVFDYSHVGNGRFELEVDDIFRVRTKWTPLRHNTRLLVFYNRDGERRKANFFVGTKYSKELRTLLTRLNRS